MSLPRNVASASLAADTDVEIVVYRLAERTGDAVSEIAQRSRGGQAHSASLVAEHVEQVLKHPLVTDVTQADASRSPDTHRTTLPTARVRE
jgi:hypothetical protein